MLDAAPSPVAKRSAGAEFRRSWKSLLASCIGLGVGLAGIPFFTFGVFVLPLMDAFGWSRGQTAGATSALIVATAVTEPIVGSIIDRIGVRRVALISMLAVIVPYVALTKLNGNIVVFYAMWFLLAVIGAGTTPVVWSRAVSVWFDRGRGRALGVMLAGAGLSGILGPIFCAWLIAAYGWQAGYLGIAGIILFIGWPTVFFLLEEPPVQTLKSTNPIEGAGVRLHSAVRTVVFWKLAVGFFFVAAPLAGTIVNLVPLLIDRGVSPMSAAQIAGLMSVSIVLGRVGVGVLLDRFHAPAVAASVLALTAAGCLLLVTATGSIAVATASVLVIGLGAGAEMDLVAFLTGRYFGMKDYGKIYGWQSSAFYVAAAAGPIAAGLAFDALNSYAPLLYAAVGGIAFGAILVGSLGRPLVAVEEGR